MSVNKKVIPETLKLAIVEMKTQGKDAVTIRDALNTSEFVISKVWGEHCGVKRSVRSV